jgi:chemotaxis protein MotB
MVSYVDILTLVLIFFVVAAARSLAIPPARAITIPVRPSSPPQKASEEPRTHLIRAQSRLQDQGPETKLEAHGLIISLPQVVLFSPGADMVSPEALPTIGQIAEAIRDIPNEVRLVGHADTVPIHNRRFHSNWDLSMARSQKILELLSTRFGISEARLSIASYGPYRPAAPNDTEDGRASNRRVEIVILEENHVERPQAE